MYASLVASRAPLPATTEYRPLAAGRATLRVEEGASRTTRGQHGGGRLPKLIGVLVPPRTCAPADSQGTTAGKKRQGRGRHLHRLPGDRRPQDKQIPSQERSWTLSMRPMPTTTPAATAGEGTSHARQNWHEHIIKTRRLFRPSRTRFTRRRYSTCL